ncbi:PepSY-like domain-containing protein [Leadbetterella byssophila]|uniref:PepSY-like domain-containing protein n=1 Tax=Leadbetterella byssophila TaxID=316068 RepID=UPI0039A2D326
MKKIIVLLLFPMALFAQKDKKIDWDELPQKAQTFLKINFTKEKAQKILKETEDYLETIYQVTFQGKLKIKFDKNGNWKEVDGHRKPIPTRFIPEKILTYIKKSFPNNEVVKIEKEKRKYEVEISNGLELEFDRDGNFLRIDS